MLDEHQKIDCHARSQDKFGKKAVDPNQGLSGSVQPAVLGSLLRDSLGTLVLGSGLRFGRLDHQVRIEKLGQGDGGRHTYHGCEGQHQSNHDTGEVTSEEGIYNDEDVLIGQFLEAEVDASGEQPDQHVEIEEESGPGSRLMLRHGCNDRDMDLGIASVTQRVEPTGPGCNVSSSRESNQPEKCNAKNGTKTDIQEGLELFTAGNGRPNILDEGYNLNETEDACSIISLLNPIDIGPHYLPRAGMCSLVLTAKNPTKGI